MPPSEKPYLTAGRLRLQFEWRGDRFGHCILSMADGRELAASVDGAAADAWPPSPPLQELHFSTSADGQPVALAVGRAGTQHWSVSFEPQPAGFLLDVACRVRGSVERLSSTYRLAHEVTGAPNQPHGPLEFAPAPLEPGTAICTVARDAQTIIVTPRCESGDTPRTIRWRYAISLPPLPGTSR